MLLSLFFLSLAVVQNTAVGGWATTKLDTLGDDKIWLHPTRRHVVGNGSRLAGRYELEDVYERYEFVQHLSFGLFWALWLSYNVFWACKLLVEHAKGYLFVRDWGEAGPLGLNWCAVASRAGDRAACSLSVPLPPLLGAVSWPPPRSAVGRTCVGRRQPVGGVELQSPRLAHALRTQHEFSVDEWSALGVRGVGPCSYVKSGRLFFEPRRGGGAVLRNDRNGDAAEAWYSQARGQWQSGLGLLDVLRHYAGETRWWPRGALRGPARELKADRALYRAALERKARCLQWVGSAAEGSASSGSVGRAHSTSFSRGTSMVKMPSPGLRPSRHAEYVPLDAAAAEDDDGAGDDGAGGGTALGVSPRAHRLRRRGATGESGAQATAPRGSLSDAPSLDAMLSRDDAATLLEEGVEDSDTTPDEDGPPPAPIWAVRHSSRSMNYSANHGPGM